MKYTDEYISAQMKKENQGKAKSLWGPIIDTVENMIPIYDIVHGATQIGSGVAGAFDEKDKFGVAHNDTMKGISAGLDWSGSLMNWFDTGDWGNVHQRGRLAEMQGMQQNEINQDKALQKRLMPQTPAMYYGGYMPSYFNGTDSIPDVRAQERMAYISKIQNAAGVSGQVYNPNAEPFGSFKSEPYYDRFARHEMQVRGDHGGQMPIYTEKRKGSPEAGIGSLPSSTSSAIGPCLTNSNRGGAVDNWGTGGTNKIKKAYGGYIPRYAQGGNAYVNDNEVIVSNQTPQGVQGGQFDKIAPNMWSVNAYNDGTDNVLANIQPGSKVISDDMQYPMMDESLAEELQKLAKKRETAQKKLDKAPTKLMKHTYQKNLDNIEAKMKQLVEMQPSNPEQDQQGQQQMQPQQMQPMMRHGGRVMMPHYTFGSDGTEGNGYEQYYPQTLKSKFTNQYYKGMDINLNYFNPNAQYNPTFDDSSDPYYGAQPLSEMYGYQPLLNPNKSDAEISSELAYNKEPDATGMPQYTGSVGGGRPMGKFASYLQNDPTSFGTIAQGAMGLANLGMGIFGDVSRLPDAKFDSIRSQDDPFVQSYADEYMRKVSPTNMSAMGMDPSSILGAMGMGMEQYSQAQRQNDVLNSQIGMGNNNRRLQTSQYNREQQARANQYRAQQKQYYDQGEARKYGQIGTGSAELLASLAKILPQVI